MWGQEGTGEKYQIVMVYKLSVYGVRGLAYECLEIILVIGNNFLL